MVSGKKADSRLQPSFSLIEGLGLADFLQEDPRPSFAIDLTRDLSADLEVIFINQAFNDAAPLANVIISKPLTWPYIERTGSETAALALWARCGSKNERFRFRNLIWTSITIHKRWRIISGMPITEIRESENHYYTDLDGAFSPPSPQLKRLSIKNDTTQDASPENSFAVLSLLATPPSQHNQLILNFDWQSTPLGPIHQWPQALTQIVSHVMASPNAAIIYWGKERTIIHNEAYSAVIQKLSPAIGHSAPVKFAPWWPYFELVAQQAEKTGCAVRYEDTRVILNRSGFLEETYFAYSFTPIRGPNGTIHGLYNEAKETTKQNILERRLSTLIKLGEGTARTTKLSKFWDRLFSSMPGTEPELPFVVLYSIGEALTAKEASRDANSNAWDGENWFLEGQYGFPHGHKVVPRTLNKKEASGFAPAIRACQEAGSCTVVLDLDDIESLPELFTVCPDRGFGVDYKRIVVCPLQLSFNQTTAWLILGLNPLVRYDDNYRRFVDLLCRQIEDVGTSVVLLEKEKYRLQKTVEHAEYQRQVLSEKLQQQTRETQESELRFLNFAKQAPLGVYIIGPQGEIKYANDTFYKMFSITPNSPGGQLWRARIHPDDQAATDLEFQKLISGKLQTDYELRVLKEDLTGDESKDVMYLRTSAFSELAEDGSTKTITGVVVDISLHKAHERAAEDRLADALEAKRAQENFMDMVSHEMRNPLNAILQCGEEASQSLQPLTLNENHQINDPAFFANILEPIHTILYCGQHQKQIIDDVLTISKLDSDLLTLSPAPVLPSTVLRQAFRIFASEIKASDISTSWELGSSSIDLNRTPVSVDSGRVLQILINLMGNSIKFLRGRSSRKLHVRVSTSTTKPSNAKVRFIPSGRQRRESTGRTDWGEGQDVYVYFSVADSGPGLIQDEIDSLFARFKQASPRTHAQYGGSGLGLFISRELSELHGGEIGLSSEINKGSTFAFYVRGRAALDGQPKGDPRSLPDQNKYPFARRTILATGAPSTPTPTSSITILIVEDNLVNQKVLNRQLRKLGYETVTANHGVEALSAVQKSTWWRANPTPADSTSADRPGTDPTRLSIILCDLEMPVMDGVTFVRQIRAWQEQGKLEPDIPVVAVTGNARPEQVNAAKEAGFVEVVCKPYSVPDLVPMIQRMVARSTEGLGGG